MINASSLLETLKKLYPKNFLNGVTILLLPTTKKKELSELAIISSSLQSNSYIMMNIDNIEDVKKLKADLQSLGVAVSYEESETNPYYNRLIIHLH